MHFKPPWQGLAAEEHQHAYREYHLPQLQYLIATAWLMLREQLHHPYM
jgi:hypothetical protein